jgi:hypothetical protein
MFGIQKGLDVVNAPKDGKIAGLSFWPSTAVGASANIIARFQQLKDLYHPNLCQYLDVGKSGKGNTICPP